MKQQWLIKPKPSELLLGVAGMLSTSPSDLQSKFSSMDCQDAFLEQYIREQALRVSYSEYRNGW